MPVPDFQTLMRPLLEEYATGGERPISDVRAVLANRLGLTEDRSSTVHGHAGLVAG